MVFMSAALTNSITMQKGIRPGKDFSAEWHDIHLAKSGDKCSKCGAELKIEKCIEIGQHL